MNHSNWLASRHSITEVTAEIKSEANAYSDYIKNSQFETMKVFEREYNSGIGLTKNIPITPLNYNIPLNRLNENIPLTLQT